jgi:dihydrofolate reductase
VTELFRVVNVERWTTTGRRPRDAEGDRERVDDAGRGGSTLLRGDIGAAVRALKAEDGKDLHIIGSPGLVQTLLVLGLVDELRLMIDPLVVGGGKRLFHDDGAHRPLRLANSQVTSTGAIIATYAPVGG